MKPTLHITISRIIVGIYLVLSTGCITQEILSVSLEPVDHNVLALGDSIQIRVATDPLEVDSVVLSQIDQNMVQSMNDTYSAWWKPDQEGSFEILATAYLGSQSMESDDTLHIQVVEYFSRYLRFNQGKSWVYEDVCTNTCDYPEDHALNDTTWSDTLTYTQEVTGQDSLQANPDIKVWELKSFLDGDPLSTCYYCIAQDSIYVYQSTQDSIHWYSLPSNPEIGDVWKSVSTDSLENVTYEVVSEDEEANGYTDCIKIKVMPKLHEHDEEFSYYYWWTPDVWEVLTERHEVTKVYEDTDTTIIIQDRVRTLTDYYKGI